MISAETLGWIFVAATVATLPALWAVAGLPRYAPGRPNDQGPLRRIADGGHFVLGNGYLRAIAGCALFWNFAFSALLVTMVPLVTDAFLMEPGIFGIAMACFGLAAFAGSGIAARYAGRIRPNLLLLFGPASSVPAVLLLLTVAPGGSPFAIYAAFFGLGFGPAMWLIAQNSVRQIVSPRDMLGRVNAMIQTTIYGARPLGALCGGFLVAATAPRDALAFIAGCFALSFAVAAISRLRTIRSYGDLAAAEAA
ncbi:MAG: MFS transporter [Thalassobaculaceae bacterium]|uniref:MFS transporter n=1 Tax=Parvibaculum sp. TaxID=2024848 RepID=UPI0032EF09AD